MARPISRATHSPRASVRKLRMTLPRKDSPNRTLRSRARKPVGVASAAASGASTGLKGSSLLSASTGLLDGLEVRREVSVFAPQALPGVVASGAEVVAKGTVGAEAF